MNIVYFSKGIRGIACLEAVLQAGYTVAAVIGSGRDDELNTLCEMNNLPLHMPEKPNTLEVAELLKTFEADIFVCSGYNKILKPIIFNIPRLGTINLHGGRLPFYRGAAPTNWQIINGENEGGCCILFLDEGIDTGPIICQESYQIAEDDNHQSILEKVLKIFPRLLVNVLHDFENDNIHSVEQNLDEGCHYTRRYPEDSRINWQTMTDVQIHSLVRGMNGPFPHAFTFRGDEKVEIDRTALLKEEIKGVSGRVPLKRNEGVVVLCQNRGILVKEIRIKGEKLNPRKFFNIGEIMT